MSAILGIDQPSASNRAALHNRDSELVHPVHASVTGRWAALMSVLIREVLGLHATIDSETQQQSWLADGDTVGNGLRATGLGQRLF